MRGKRCQRLPCLVCIAVIPKRGPSAWRDSLGSPLAFVAALVLFGWMVACMRGCVSQQQNHYAMSFLLRLHPAHSQVRRVAVHLLPFVHSVHRWLQSHQRASLHCSAHCFYLPTCLALQRLPPIQRIPFSKFPVRMQFHQCLLGVAWFVVSLRDAVLALCMQQVLPVQHP